jgi:hypothetical protein
MNQFLETLMGVAIPLAVWTGYMIWWMSRITSDVKSLKEDSRGIRITLSDHIEEDKHMQEQIQSMAVNEANVAGTLGTFALEIKQIRQYIEAQDMNNGRVLELKLREQNFELINRFRTMLEEERKESEKRWRARD